MKPDKVCKKYSDKKIKIKIYTESGMVFIEGTSISLEFIGKLFLAQSKFKEDCGFQIMPKGAGKIFFHNKSERGLYIHRVPCKGNETGTRKRK